MRVTRVFSTSLVLAITSATTPAQADEVLYAMTSPTFPTLVELDKINGAWITSVPISGHEALFGGLAADPARGVLFSIDGYNDPNPDRLFAIDPLSGIGDVIGPTGENWNFRCVDRHPVSGRLYATRDNALYTINPATGAVSKIANITGSTLDQLTAFAIDQHGEAYGTDIGDVGLFRIDLQTGAATHIANAGGNRFNDLTFDSSGTLYGAESRSDVFTIDLATASKTFAFPGTFVGLSFWIDSCYPDCDQSTGAGVLDIFDFLCFQDRFVNADPYACECDISTGPGVCDIFDFLCFQNAFVGGCP